jgi:FMN reductase [NAD(P)H]
LVGQACGRYDDNVPARPVGYGGRVEFRDVLRRRRMHRAFLPDPIPEEQIARVANVIRHSPSGGFSQGGSIVVVTDAEMRLQIAREFTDDHPEAAESYIAVAPVQLVVSASEAFYHARYNEPDKLDVTGRVELDWPVPYWFVDAGALMMAVLMAAIDEGLASAFIGHERQKEILDRLLGLPPDVVPIGVALVGKPAETPDIGSRLRSRRRPDADLVHWGTW